MKTCRDCKYYRDGWCCYGFRYAPPVVIKDVNEICRYFEEANK